MSTKEYKQLKNHLHNTLDISKDNIREIVEKAVERIVERKLEVLFRDHYTSQYSMQRIIDDSIRQKITQRNWFWGESESKLDDYIKQEVVDKLLKGVKLKVEIVNRDKDATKPHPTIKIRKMKRPS